LSAIQSAPTAWQFLPGVRVSSGPAAQRLLDGIQQILMTEWLGEKFYCPRLHGPHGHRNVPMRGDNDDWNLNVGLCQFTLEIEPTYAG
jgi:hypothetical protein